MAYAYPIQIDVADRLIVIIGGGAVAARKATGLQAAGATRVRCVSPAFHAQLPSYVERITASYESAHLEGATLVFAATNSADINDAVVRDARQRHILVNRADGEDDDAASGVTGDFTVPAVHRAGPLVVTVATGASPALAVAVRDRLASALELRWVALAEAMLALRPEVLRSSLSISDRRETLRALATPDAADAAARGGVDELRQWMQRRTRSRP